MKLRIKFSKTGCMKFVGHLDMMRYFQKALRRAKIPVEFTKGFSPHISMAFAAPLGVGIESMGEYFDVDVEEHLNESFADNVLERLNAQMVEGIHIEAVTVLPPNSKNVMASLTAAAYSVYINSVEPSLDLKNAFDSFIGLEHFMVTKKTKTGEKAIDLSEHIFKADMRDGVIHLILDASSAGNVNPKLIMDAFTKTLPEGTGVKYSVKRTQMYMSECEIP